MKGSGCKKTRQEILSTEGLADLLRRLAMQIEHNHTVSLEDLTIVLGHQLHVQQDYRKDGRGHTFQLQLMWEESLSDQTKVQDEEADTDEELPSVLDETGVPTTPLEMPGPEERARLRGR